VDLADCDSTLSMEQGTDVSQLQVSQLEMLGDLLKPFTQSRDK